MNKEYHGACMCGAVRFSFSGPPRFVADCVCQSCRQAHGATAVCWVGVKTPAFRIDAGEDLLTWYRSGPESERGFCSACGTRILFRSDKWPGEVHLAVACVESPHDLKSTGVAFKEEFPKWTALTVGKPAG
ncbi:GFA family protein [Lentisalinibacter orientalis]